MPLPEESNESTTTKCSNLIFDGPTYHWIGNLIELKSYLEHCLKLDGVWSSPGGDAKMFKSSEGLSFKWYGRKSKKIVILKDNSQSYLAKLLQAHAKNSNSSDKVDGSVCDRIDISDDDNQIIGNNMEKSDHCSESNDMTDSMKSFDFRLNQSISRIKEIEDKFDCKVNFILDELCELKSKTISSVYEQRISILEERNRKLEEENVLLTNKFLASSCIISDLNSKVKDLENDKLSLVTAIKLIQVQDNQYSATHTNSATVEIDNSPTSNTLDDSVQILKPLLTDDQVTKKDKRLVRKYKFRKNHPSKINTQHVTSDTATLPLHNEVLSTTNEYPLMNDMNNHKDELITIQDSQRQDQIQNDSVCLQDLAGDNEINDVNEVEPQLKTKHPNEKSCIVMIGDSIIKHIDPKKLLKNKVYKYTYPGDTAESIATKVCALKPQIAPSHVIIHAGTNNIPTDTADDCAQKIVNLAGKLKEKFPNSKIGLSSIIQRQDIQVATKIDEANKILKQKCMDIGMSFIDNYTLDSTCLNGSNIHLNAKGSAILATKFITFLRGNKSSKTSHYHEDFSLTTLHQLGNLLRTIGIFPVHKYQKKKRR